MAVSRSTTKQGMKSSTATAPSVKPEMEHLLILAEEQHVKPADFDALLGDFWPSDESVDEFVAALREWRREGTAG